MDGFGQERNKIMCKSAISCASKEPLFPCPSTAQVFWVSTPCSCPCFPKKRFLPQQSAAALILSKSRESFSPLVRLSASKAHGFFRKAQGCFLLLFQAALTHLFQGALTLSEAKPHQPLQLPRANALLSLL